MGLEKVLSMLPGDALAWLTRHVRLKVVPVEEFPHGYGYAAWGEEADDRFVIGLREDILDDPREALWTLHHEIAHIVRGDLVVMREKELDGGLWNIATDAVINQGLKGHMWKPPTRRDWDDLAREHPGLPSWRTGAMPIYEYLREKCEGGGGGDGEGGEDALIVSGDINALRRAWMRAAVQAPASIAAGTGVELVRNPVAPKPVELPPLASFLEKLIRKATGGSIRKPARTYVREGRVEGLKGQHRLYRGRVVLALDVSGSMSEWWGTAESLHRELERQGILVERWAWADDAAPWPVGAEIPNVGGGTQIAPLMRAVPDADAVVVFTDGEVFDADEGRRVARKRELPVFWVLTGDGETPWEGPSVKVGRT